jgi:hypothetical protein
VGPPVDPDELDEALPPPPQDTSALAAEASKADIRNRNGNVSRKRNLEHMGEVT